MSVDQITNSKQILKSERLIDINDLAEANYDLMVFELAPDFKIDESDLKNMFYFYGSRRFAYWGLDRGEQVGFFQFCDSWNHYCAENRDNWLKVWNALKAEYNPINNYDMNESETIHHDGNDVTDREIHTHRESGTVSPTEVRNYATTYENTTGSLTNYSTQSVDNNEAENGTDTITQTTADVERMLTRSGNIGVTTSQQMLTSEIELRKYNLKHEIITQFINTYTYMGGGD